MLWSQWVYRLHEIQINFYKTNIHFPWFSECHACLYSRIVPLSYFKQHEALKLKELFSFFTGAEFYSHELVEWKAVVWYCASESFHWRKESCHMVYQGSASADVSLGRCHGFKVASILSDSHGERITAAAEIIVRDLSRHQCVYIQHIQKHTPNIHVCTFKYGWGSWMRSFEFRIKIPRLPFNDRMVSWCFLRKNETYSPLCYFLFP